MKKFARTFGQNNGIVLEARTPHYWIMTLEFIVLLFQGGGSEELGGDGPRVIAIRDDGREAVIGQFTSMRRARRAVECLMNELEMQGFEKWCNAHHLSQEFISDVKEPGHLHE